MKPKIQFEKEDVFETLNPKKWELILTESLEKKDVLAVFEGLREEIEKIEEKHSNGNFGSFLDDLDDILDNAVREIKCLKQ